jgi:hypothetical protein
LWDTIELYIIITLRVFLYPWFFTFTFCFAFRTFFQTLYTQPIRLYLTYISYELSQLCPQKLWLECRSRTASCPASLDRRGEGRLDLYCDGKVHSIPCGLAGVAQLQVSRNFSCWFIINVHKTLSLACRRLLLSVCVLNSRLRPNQTFLS